MDLVTVDSLRQLREEALAGMIEFVASQKELWQQVPWLACEAQMPDKGYQKYLAYPYVTGLWPVYDLTAGRPGFRPLLAFINCAKGIFADIEKAPLNILCEGTAPTKEAASLLRILLNPSIIDANEVIADLKAAVDHPPLKSPRAAQLDRWRADLRAKYNVRPIYN